MNVTILPGAGLSANSAALASFQRAADAWDVLFSDPVQVFITADFSTSFSSSSTIGSTNPVVLSGDYDLIRSALLADSVGNPDKAIVNYLPTAAQFLGTVPVGFTLSGNIQATKANLKALGFTDLDLYFGQPDASMVFNSNFPFYYGTGPVPAGYMDFQTVATHEIGHALGFLSAVDDVDSLLHSNSTDAISIALLDLYRFAGTLPNSTASFTDTPRDFVPGHAATLSDTSNYYSMSTGYYNGDGRQASHWKADELSGTFLGVMDPTLAFGARESITAADIRALELIGYDVAVPEPATLTLIFGATGLLAFARRKLS